MRAVRSLHFQEDRRAELRGIDPRQWPALLELTDRSQITLPLGIRCRDLLPDFVRERIDRNLAANALRHERILTEYQLIADALGAHSIEFVVLKGLTQIAPLYVCDPRYRPQYDIDLYCPPESLDGARSALATAGFLPVETGRKHTDHLPPLMRNATWNWQGDYYARDLPLTVEIHFRFWDPETERLPAPCAERFWSRLSGRIIDGVEIPMLSLADGVSYTALHLMRHLLRGAVRTYHGYELAHFLHNTAGDDRLWQEWSVNRGGAQPVLESVAFRLAVEWFGCRTHPVVEAEMKHLPQKIIRWFELFAFSPLSGERPNKDELFLHLSLLANAADRRSIVARRLLPAAPARLVASGQSGSKSIGDGFRQALFFADRLVHHARATLTLIRSLFRWKTAGRRYAVS